MNKASLIENIGGQNRTRFLPTVFRNLPTPQEPRADKKKALRREQYRTPPPTIVKSLKGGASLWTSKHLEPLNQVYL